MTNRSARRLPAPVSALISVSVAALCATTASSIPAAAQNPVRFVSHNRDGSMMTCEQFRTIQRNGADDRGWNDALVRSSTLEVVDLAPIECAANTFTIRGAGPGLALSFAWPSPRGYSNIILDFPAGNAIGPFEELVAAQALRDLKAVRVAVGATPKNSPALEKLRRSVGTSKGIARSNAAWATFDAATNEHFNVLENAGRKGANRGWKGVTLRAAPKSTDWDAASRAVGARGYVRLVFDLDEPLNSYTDSIDAAHQRNLLVLGQFADSSQMKSLTADQWNARIASALIELPGVDAWEVGSQANAGWVGEDAAVKVSAATAAVRAHDPKKPTVLTLNWSLGEGDSAEATFNWLSNVSSQTASQVSVVGLSIYPEDHPMGTAYDRVVRTLRARFPSAAIAVTELGYGNDEVAPTWWWGSASDRIAGRRAVARFYDAASRAHPFGGGGTFWWYFQPEGDVR